MSSMMALSQSAGDVPQLGALAFAVANLMPELFAPVGAGETLAEYAARRTAAADILDDLLIEAAEVAGGVR